jgi:hypothetical protein
MSAPRDELDAARPQQGDASVGSASGFATDLTGATAGLPSSGNQPAVSATHLAENPWFWVALFGVGALAALLASTPKYGMRQGAIETKFQNRERAIQWQGEQVDSTAAIEQTRLPRLPAERSLLIPLWPVMLVIAGVVVFAITRLWLPQLSVPASSSDPNSAKHSGGRP